GRLLQTLLAQPLQVEREVGLEDLLQEADEALGARLGLGQVGQRLLHLAGRRYAHLVPVEELLAQRLEGPVGLLARGALATGAVDELLQDRQRLGLRGVVPLLEGAEELVQLPLLVSDGGHKRSHTPSPGW